MSRQLAVVPDPPTPAVQNVRIGRLDTVRGVRVELARVYRQMRRGHITEQSGCRLAYVLGVLAKMHELSDIEKRLEALEGGTCTGLNND